jgi:hypothetical protein
VFRPLTWISEPLAKHWRALLAVNVAYFGMVIAAVGYAALNPVLQGELLEAIGQAFSPSGALGPLVSSYIEGRLAAAIGLTFLVNLVVGSAVMLTLPSLIVPFGGLITGLYRAFLWGILFSPTASSPLGSEWLLALPTILLEGEAYVIAMLGVWLWWWPVVRTRGRRWACWRAGALLQARIYPAVIVMLLLAAVVEASSVILIAR